MSSMFGKTRNVPWASERHPQSLPQQDCNVAILGRQGSGKSALTVKFLTKRFIGEYDPNLEDTYASEEIVDQQPVLLKVMDTANQDMSADCDRYLNWANAFMVVYSIDNRKSFEGCQQYLDMISFHLKNLSLHEWPVFLVGNKVDLEPYRQVPKAEGISLASKHRAFFHEVSACLDFESVQFLFHEAVRAVRREMERPLGVRPLFILEEKSLAPLIPTATIASTCHPLSTVNYKEIPSIARAKLVTVKSSRAQSKRKAPTLTLLKGLKIF